MTPTVFIMCVLLYLAVRWPQSFLKAIVMLISAELRPKRTSIGNGKRKRGSFKLQGKKRSRGQGR